MSSLRPFLHIEDEALRDAVARVERDYHNHDRSTNSQSFWHDISLLTSFNRSALECKQRWQQLTTTGHKNNNTRTVSSSSQQQPSPQQQQPTPSSSSNNGTAAAAAVVMVVIRVYDDARQVDQEFTCERERLVAGMRYFSRFLGDENVDASDIDIAVHCDIVIFQWLISYLYEPSAQLEHALGVHNCISILVAAEYLQMQSLVNECVQFVVEHLDEVIQSPMDLSCLSATVLRYTAALLSPKAIETLTDPHDKLQSRLFRHKLELELRKENNHLFQCNECHQLYTYAQRHRVPCTSPLVHVSFHGEVHACHVPNLSFDPRMYVTHLRANNVSWREIFWRIWAIIHYAMCRVCHQYFNFTQLTHCAYHLREPIFLRGENTGFHVCCDRSVQRFRPLVASPGCRARAHELDTEGEDDESAAASLALFSMAQEMQGIISVPFKSGTTVGDMTMMARNTITSLSYRPSDKYVMREVTYHDHHGRGVSGVPGATATASSSSSSSSAAAAAANNNNTSSKKKNKKKNKQQKSSKRRAGSAKRTTSATASSSWKTDSLRFDDRDRMMSLVDKLMKLRTKQQHHTQQAEAKVAAATPISSNRPRTGSRRRPMTATTTSTRIRR